MQSDTVRHFATVHGFTYQLATLLGGGGRWRHPPTNTSLCAYDLKVVQVWRTLHSLPEGDWLLYLDLDMQYACDDPRANDPQWLGSMLPVRAREDSSECHFIARHEFHAINTGFVALRANQKGRDLVDAWNDGQRRLRVCEGSADQHALQSAVLTQMGVPSARCDEYANRHVNGDDPPNARRPNVWLDKSNDCFEDKLMSAGTQEQGRIRRVPSQRGICLLSDLSRGELAAAAGGRVQSFMDYQKGDVFRHKQPSADMAKRCLMDAPRINQSSIST